MNKSQTRTCQNCKNEFNIEPDDFAFYKKIDTPPPTFCPPCRLQRRLAVRNERILYKRNCGLCEKAMLSMYDTEEPFMVFCKDCWWGDGWDPMKYARDYDFNTPFFVQFRKLLEDVPRPNLIVSSVKDCDYCNYIADGKNCYLCFGSIAVEDCMYGAPYESRDCIDTYLARECEYCYETIDCEKLSSSAHVQDCANSLNLLYCFDCKNCQDCIGCVGLRNKQYYILNEPYSKEEYRKERDKILAGGRTALLRIAADMEKLKNRIPHRFATTLQCIQVSGDHIVNSKNAKECFDVKRCEDGRYCVRMIDGKDVHDTNYCEFMERSYDYIGFWKDTNIKFSNTCGESTDIEYSDFCFASKNLFGCIALQKKSYCVLNKQYAKEEYQELIQKIKKQMNKAPYQDTNGRVYVYGEFFPIELSPFAYNETVAQEYFPLTRKQVEASGYRWKEPKKKQHGITIKSENVAETITDVDDSVVQETIGCAHGGTCNEQCTTAFKITPQELQFYKKMRLPLPLLCSNCRHYERLKKRNPFTLWHRRCNCAGKESDNGRYANTIEHAHSTGHCPNEFETAYAPERKEIVYCEQCYNAEIV